MHLNTTFFTRDLFKTIGQSEGNDINCQPTQSPDYNEEKKTKPFVFFYIPFAVRIEWMVNGECPDIGICDLYWIPRGLIF